MNQSAISEGDLQAYVDGALPATRRAEVEEYLAAQPQEAARVQAYRQQNEALQRLFDPLLDETPPDRLLAPRRASRRWSPLRHAAVLAWIALGGMIGWQLGSMQQATTSSSASLVRQAAIAHVLFSPEVRHPVEVSADQEAHLVNWLSKRLNAPLIVPRLGELGYSLVGGRLLPGDNGAVAQFMYQDEKGRRLTLYVRSSTEEVAETAFRFARQDQVSVFYWLDGKLGYALSGEIDKAQLLRVATAVYQQLNP